MMLGISERKEREQQGIEEKGKEHEQSLRWSPYLTVSC